MFEQEIRKTLHLVLKNTYPIDYWKEKHHVLTQQKKVAEKNKRKYIKRIANIWFRGKNAMPKQAKTLNAVELRKVLDYVATRKHSLRNRALVMFMFNTGVRVSKCANLRYD